MHNRAYAKVSETTGSIGNIKLDSDKNYVVIAVLPTDADEPTEENEGKDNDVNYFSQHRFEYKLWALCRSEKYCYNFPSTTVKNLMKCMKRCFYWDP